MPSRSYPTSLVLGLAASATALLSSGYAWAADIKVDPATKYQTMSGWEVTLSGLLEIDISSNPKGAYEPSLNAKLGPTIISRLVNDLGVNRVRLEVKSGQENPVDYFSQWTKGQTDYDGMESHFYEKINDNSDPQVAAPGGFQFGHFDFTVETELLPIKAAVEANGEKLYINLNYVDFKGKPMQGTLHHGSNPAEYAELILVAFDRLKTKYGLTPNALEIILEPENTNDWAGGTPIGQAIVAVKARLHASGYDPEIIAPSVMNASSAVPYFNDILKVAGASTAMTMLAYHRYGGGDYAGILSAAKSHGLQTGMLELTTGTIDTLFEDLTVVNVSAWQKWGLVVDSRLVSPSNIDYAYIYADLNKPATPTIGFSPNTGALLPCFRYVRSGAVRVGAQSNDAQFRPVAFVNSNGSNVIVVRANGAGTLAISGVPDGTYGVKSSTLNGQLTDGNAVTASGGKMSVTVPSGVTAIYDQKTPGPNRGGTAGPGDGGAPGDAGRGSDASTTGTGGMTGVGGGVVTGTGGASPGIGSGSGGPTGSGGAAQPGGATGTGGNSSSGTAADSIDDPSAGGTESGCACRVGDSRSPLRGIALSGLLITLAMARSNRKSRSRERS